MSNTTNATVAALRANIAKAREEHADFLARQRTKGRQLAIDNEEMIAACERYIESGQPYPAAPEPGVWFPDTLMALAHDVDWNPSLGLVKREAFARTYDEDYAREQGAIAGDVCPAWRQRGW